MAIENRVPMLFMALCALRDAWKRGALAAIDSIRATQDSAERMEPEKQSIRSETGKPMELPSFVGLGW
jgi:hypothetical protein